MQPAACLFACRYLLLLFFSFSFESHSVTLISKPQIYLISLELIWPALLLGPLIVVRIGMLLEDFQVGVVLYAEKEGRSQFSRHYIYTLCFYSPLEKSIKSTRSVKEKRKRKLTSSLRQNAQMDLGLAAFTGVPLGLTLARVPAASAFFCSRWMRSFLEMGIFSFSFDGGGWREEMRRFLDESQTMVVAVVVCDEGRAEADCVQSSRYRKKRVDSIVSGRREVK